MAAGLGADGGEGFHAGAVLLHVLATGTAEGFQGTRQVDIAGQVFHDVDEIGAGLRAVIPVRLERAGLHLLETQCQHAIGLTALHGGTGQVQGGRTGGAIVVDVDDRDRRAPHFIECRLAAGGIAIDITGKGHLHLVIVDAGIFERQAHRRGSHVGVAGACTRLREGNHADPGNYGFFTHGWISFGVHVQLSYPPAGWFSLAFILGLRTSALRPSKG
ncbi:hypothetical protein D3C87_1502190 [compost metagenome]